MSEATFAFRVFYGNVLYLPYLLFSFNDLPLPINFFTHLFPDLFIENHSSYRQRYILIPRRESRLRGEKHANVSTCLVISVVENFRNFARQRNFTNIQSLLLGGYFLRRSFRTTFSPVRILLVKMKKRTRGNHRSELCSS